MFLTVHSATGIVIGQYIHNPLLAFIVGLVAHYLFDIIPHGDTKVAEKYKNPIHIALAGIIDMIILTAYLLIISFQGINLLQPNIAAAVIGCALPDILQAFYYVFRGKIFTRLQKIHNFFHDMISSKYDFNLPLGLIFQTIILILITLIIFK